MSETIDKSSDNLIEPGIFGRDKDLAKRASEKGVKVIKERKKFREIIMECLTLQAPDKIKEKLKQVFPNLPEKMTIDTAMTLSMLLQSTQGNYKAFKMLAEMVDGMPRQTIDINSDNKTEETIKIEFIKPSKQDENTNT